jgi:hypothetical protein
MRLKSHDSIQLTLQSKKTLSIENGRIGKEARSKMPNMWLKSHDSIQLTLQSKKTLSIENGRIYRTKKSHGRIQANLQSKKISWSNTGNFTSFSIYKSPNMRLKSHDSI